MNNREVAHLWANQSRESASGSHFYFQGDTIYSYGSHFPIARHCRGAVLFTTRRYSKTTAKHISYTLRACSHLLKFFVDDPTLKPGAADLNAYKKRIEEAALAYSRARVGKEWKLTVLNDLVEEANKFAGHFHFKQRFFIPNESQMHNLKEQLRKAREQERKAIEKREREVEAENAERIKEWLAGQRSYLHVSTDRVYLRAKDGMMETSKGARVPLDAAKLAYRFALSNREKGWHRNGGFFKLGDYQLDAVNEFGVIAGCHRVSWDEIERFAKEMKWTE